VSIKGLDMELIQEPCYWERFIRGHSIPGYILFSTIGIERPRACILTRKETPWILPGFFCRDLVVVLIKYNDDWAELWLMFRIYTV
jgi:hypothetical protein